MRQSDCPGHFLVQRLKRSFSEDILAWDKVLKVVMALAELGPDLWGKFLDDDLNILPQGVIVFYILCEGLDTLRGRGESEEIRRKG